MLPSDNTTELPPPDAAGQMFDAAMYVVPGIPSIERLPEPLRWDPRYTFAGPLNLSDDLVAAMASVSDRFTMDRTRLERFLDRHQDKPIVFLTLGTVASASPELCRGIRQLLARGIAVVSTVSPFDDGSAVDSALLQHELLCLPGFVPLGLVCGRSDLVIHHCGSGTYHYALQHGAPTIVVGTSRYDRDDVGRRLEDLGVAVYVPHPSEHSRFGEAFSAAVERCLERGYRQQLQARLLPVVDEIRRTTEAFDMRRVLRDALRAAPVSEPH
jgi:UDP:flavonoid glycosyltransferase YjiC (YdhE family)